MMGEQLTARYKVSTIGLSGEFDAVSFQDAALKMLELHNLTSVVSMAVEWDSADGGTIEFVECRIVEGKLAYITGYVLDTKEETQDAIERLYELI